MTEQKSRMLVGLIEHMGDIVACEPVSRYLKAKHPKAHLTWAVSPAYRELIDTNPYIDETLIIDCLTDWIKLTKHSSYDEIFDLHVNYRICQHCGIPLVKQTGNPFVTVYEWFDYGTLQEAFTLGAGLPRLSAAPRLYLQPEHANAVDALALPNDFCLVHLDSNATCKDWTREAWRELSEWIRNDLGLAIVEVGAGVVRGPSPLAEGSISLVNRLSILQTAEVIRRSRIFIGVDSGPAHLANALRVPGVVLLGRLGYFRQYMPFNGFFASASTLVKMVRNPTGFVSGLSVAEVKEAVRYVVTATRTRVPVPHSSLAPSLQNPSCEENTQGAAASELSDEGWLDEDATDAKRVGLYSTEPLPPPEETGLPVPSNVDVAQYLRASSDAAHGNYNPLDRMRTVPAAVMEDAPGSSVELSGSKGLGNTNAKFLERTCPRTFAFYLPQFHPIPENDWAHGPGFTEWHSVIKGAPLFRGHYQPRIPGELGFYDLRSIDVLKQQVNLALEYGISGFCFYYYYFQGKKLLYQPIKNFLESRIDMPFFYLWANENWSKRWDGGDREIIIQQKHSKEDDLAFIRELISVFNDDRYVKIEGKPLLLIYKPHLFPDILSTTELWRQEVEKFGFPGIYLTMVDDWLPHQFHPRQYGFDASYEIPSNLVPQEVFSTDLDSLELKKGFTGRIVDYQKFASFHRGRPFPEYKRFRTVMLPWDNTARYGLQSTVHINGQGDSYRLWLTQVLIDTYRRYAPEERIVFLHSWNEWCEGTYLEPDGKFGRMFLEETSEAIRIARDAIDLMGGKPAYVPAMAELLKAMQAKDEGAFRVIQGFRSHTAYLARELERARAERDRTLAERDAILASKSWQVTKPLRALTERLRGRR